MQLILQITDPWELGATSLNATVNEADLAQAAYPTDSLLADVSEHTELGGQTIYQVEARPRHLESTMSMLLTGATVRVNGEVVDPRSSRRIWFIADARRVGS